MSLCPTEALRAFSNVRSPVLARVVARAMRMHCTDKLGIAVTLAVVIAAAHTGFGSLGRTTLGSVNLILDAYCLDYAATSVNGSTNPRQIRTGKTRQLCPNQQLLAEAL